MQQFQMPDTFTVYIRKQAMEVNPNELPEAAARKVFEYGLQRILNDATGSAETEAQAREIARKRWDNLVAGIIRASGGSKGDPLAREAMRISVQVVRNAKAYRAWLAENGLKPADKQATDKLAALAADYAKRESTIAQAKANLEGVADLEVDIDI
jgi:hypothetical protein